MGKRKLGTADKVRKAKQSKSSNVFKVQNNPFEVKINKQKYKVLGRKTKHDRGLPGVSRSKSNKKRKETLLKEYKERNKSNTILDDRFGESNADISIEEKMLQRFTLEKKRKHEKMSMFNLNDDNEDLTHLGQSLSDIKDFGNDYISDEEDNGVISGEYVSEAHFGGGIFTKKKQQEDVDDKPKSRKEIMDEIILKSKQAKAQKQNARDEANILREKLDDTWQEVENLLKSSTRTAKDKEEAKQSAKIDEYDLAVKQMQYDRKAAPTAREKTPAEKAAEESARIRKMEKERLERMNERYEGAKKLTHRSADHLNYEHAPTKVFVDPVLYKDGVMVGVDEPSEEIGQDGDNWLLEPAIDDSGGSEKDDSESEKDEDDFSDIDSEDVEDDPEGDQEDSDEISDEEARIGEKEESVEKSSVSTHRFPKTYDEFATSCHKRCNGDWAKHVSHLRAHFAPNLAQGNKGKLGKLFEFVWTLLYNLNMEHPTNLEESDKLIRHLYDLCEMNPVECGQFVKKNMESSYKECLIKSGKTLLPDFGTMMKFKLIKILFSTSDYIHPVVGPSFIFMCHVLSTCRPMNLRDLGKCLFLCTLMYEYICFSKRFVPECINFLCAAICMAIPKKIQQAKGLPSSSSMYLNAQNSTLLVLDGSPRSVQNQKPNLVNILTTEDAEELNENTVKVQLLSTALRLSLRFVRLYCQLPSFKEIHEPLKAACCRCVAASQSDNQKSDEYPLANLFRELQTEIQRLMKKRPNLVPLVDVESNKPTILPMYDPKIEEVFEPFQKHSRKKISAAKREKERLQHKYKREMKGAVREIKKDARFLAREQLREQQEKDAERAAKVKRLFGFLSNQEGEVKKINRKTFKLGVS